MKQQTIRAWREEKKLTQYELSDLSGVAQATISNLESGATVTVKPSTLRKLARAMGIGFEQIDLSEVRLLKENPRTQAGAARPGAQLHHNLSGRNGGNHP